MIPSLNIADSEDMTASFDIAEYDISDDDKKGEAEV